MPDKKTQEQLDAILTERRAAEVVEVSEAPMLTSDIFESDERETSLVEINVSNMSARLVERSDAPKLTHAVLKTLGKPVKTVEFFYENNFFQVAIRDGIPLELEIKQLKKIIEYEGQENDRAAIDERDLEISRMLLSGMMVDPPFSYQGEGEGTPIEARSPVMIASLCNAFNAVNTPEKDEIYQVTVRRGVPADAYALLGESFEWYPVGGESKKYVDMSEGELAAAEARQSAQRLVLVPKMIVDPVLSYKAEEPETEAETEGEADETKFPYPVEALSERYMKTFHEAHRVVNVPEAGLKSLQRFSRASHRKRRRQKKSRKFVGK